MSNRIYYGWILVVSLAITETVSWGLLYYAFTVFLTPMQHEFGWSRSAMAGAFSLALLISGLAGVPAGRWLDRHGPRVIMTAGSCAATVLVLAWASVQSLVALYIVWACLGLTMAAVLYEPAFVVVATWFRRKRGRALTLLTFLAGFASVIFIPLAGRLVDLQGWRAALVTLAIILAVITIPLHALVLRRRPEDMGLAVDGDSPHPPTPSPSPAGEGELRYSLSSSPPHPSSLIPHPSPPATPSPERSVTAHSALRGVTFWLLMVAFFLSTLGVGVVFVHLVPYLTDRGYSAGFAASATGLVGVMALPGRLVLTPLGDRFPRSMVAAGIFALQTLSLLVLLLVHSTAGVFGFVVLFGAGFGAVTPARAALVAEFYGPAHFGSINGALGLFLTGARAAAPVGAGIVYDIAGSYDLVLWGLVVVSAISAVAVLMAEQSAARSGLVQVAALSD
ncbi:MAG: MFS transporter [Chloroflexi bacterium]|nr:MFS transporter [Chloroflexota bacterium]